MGSLPYKIINALPGYAGTKHGDLRLLSCFYKMSIVQWAWWIFALAIFIATWTDSGPPAPGTAEYEDCMAENEVEPGSCDIAEWTEEMGADGSKNDVHWIEMLNAMLLPALFMAAFINGRQLWALLAGEPAATAKTCLQYSAVGVVWVVLAASYVLLGV